MCKSIKHNPENIATCREDFCVQWKTILHLHRNFLDMPDYHGTAYICIFSATDNGSAATAVCVAS